MNSTETKIMKQSSGTFSSQASRLKMTGSKQIERSIVINASVKEVWAVIADNSLLPYWVPVVSDVTCDSDGEGVEIVRSCNVNMGGKNGTMVERCVEFVPETRASYVVDNDSLGFGKMFAEYGFTMNFDVVEATKTKVTIETFYIPRNIFYSIMNVTIVRQQFKRVVGELLAGLKAFVETRSYS